MHVRWEISSTLYEQLLRAKIQKRKILVKSSVLFYAEIRARKSCVKNFFEIETR